MIEAIYYHTSSVPSMPFSRWLFMKRNWHGHLFLLLFFPDKGRGTFCCYTSYAAHFKPLDAYS